VRRAFRWWLGRRPLGKIVDGEFVEAPQRLERTWAWLMARPQPSPPPRRIVTLPFWVLMWVSALLFWVLPLQEFLDYLSVLAWILMAASGVLALLLALSRRRR